MQECFCKSKTEDLLEWFVQLIAPVLVGAKPAEILSFPWGDKHNGRLEQIKTSILLNNKVQMKEFTYGGKCTKLFIYNTKALDDTMADKRNQLFLMKLGYPDIYSRDSYLEVLMDKMQAGSIPDEIGVFLGYPLKDVIGFMGHASLKLTKVNGWRVYGDPKVSDKKFNDFMQARAYVKQMLTHSSPKRILTAV